MKIDEASRSELIQRSSELLEFAKDFLICAERNDHESQEIVLSTMEREFSHNIQSMLAGKAQV